MRPSRQPITSRASLAKGKEVLHLDLADRYMTSDLGNGYRGTSKLVDKPKICAWAWKLQGLFDSRQ